MILNKEKLLLFVLNVNLNIRVFVSSIKGNQMKKKVYIMLCDFYVKNYLIDRTKKYLLVNWDYNLIVILAIWKI